jgi:hypothetical protein
VYDRTPGDEVVFYREIDGSRDSEQGSANGSFHLDLEEGIHSYKVYAEDLGGNRSAVLAGEVKFLARTPVIRMRRPVGTSTVLHLPPRSPASLSGPVYTVSFSVENLPEDNPALLREVVVMNSATGRSRAQRGITDIEFEFDIELTRGANPMLIEVRDVNDRVVRQNFTIEIR